MNNEQVPTETAAPAGMEEQHEAFLRSAQEYLSVREAARIMGVSSRSVYGYIERGTLLHVRIGSSLSVSAAAAQAYQRACVGRPRSRIPTWRTPVTHNLQYLWTITARLREGQLQHLAPRLAAIRAARKHQLPGTVARYIVQHETNPEMVQIVLVWRQLVMPPDEERAADIAAFQADLADLVEWETAASTEGCVLMNA